jgi:hypothetical protein
MQNIPIDSTPNKFNQNIEMNQYNEINNNYNPSRAENMILGAFDNNINSINDNNYAEGNINLNQDNSPLFSNLNNNTRQKPKENMVIKNEIDSKSKENDIIKVNLNQNKDKKNEMNKIKTLQDDYQPRILFC